MDLPQRSPRPSVVGDTRAKCCTEFEGAHKKSYAEGSGYCKK